MSEGFDAPEDLADLALRNIPAPVMEGSPHARPWPQQMAAKKVA